MDIEKKRNELKVTLEDKVVCLAGHDDIEVFTIYTEVFDTHPHLSDNDRMALRDEFKKRGDIIIN